MYLEEMRNRFRCPCGAKIKSSAIPDFPGSKSGHVVYTHVPGPPCGEFMGAIEAVTKKHGGKVVQRGGS